MIVTKEELIKARTGKGGYTGAQVRWARTKTGRIKKSVKSLEGMSFTDEEWLEFVLLRQKKKAVKKKAVIINSVTKKADWSWSPTEEDIPKPKFKGKLQKNRGTKKANRKKISQRDDEWFYSSQEWRALRVRVFQKYECRCMMCGRSPKNHGVVIHVDHIKPRSKYPELSFEFNNLQLLCEDCNLGKSNKYTTDYRPDDDITVELDERHLQEINHLI